MVPSPHGNKVRFPYRLNAVQHVMIVVLAPMVCRPDASECRCSYCDASYGVIRSLFRHRGRRAARSGKKEYKAASDSEEDSDEEFAANSEFEVRTICVY